MRQVFITKQEVKAIKGALMNCVNAISQAIDEFEFVNATNDELEQLAELSHEQLALVGVIDKLTRLKENENDRVKNNAM